MTSHAVLIKKQNHGKLIVVMIGLGLAYTGVLARLWNVQFAKAPELQERAEKQYSNNIELAPRRGIIYDRKGKELAVSMDVPSVFAVPYELRDIAETGQALSLILGIDPDTLEKRIENKKNYAWIKRKISDAEHEALSKANLPGIHIVKESKRFYPQGNLASHILGFVNIDNVGQEGIEASFEKYLRGESGFRVSERDAKRRELVSYSHSQTSSRDGDKVHLTVDMIIQYIAEREIDKIYEEYHPESVTVIVMDPHDGDILALANRPTFDPNQYQNTDPELRRNRAITDIYEPGSTFKVITASAALEEKLFPIDEKIYCENGEYDVPGRSKPLHDYHPYGWLTFEDVIKKSSNIGVVKIASRLGSQKLYEYVDRFGFGRRTNIFLPGEQNGMLRPYNTWTKSSMSAVPIGQEIAATPLQMACAFSVVANGGILVEPRIYRSIENEESVEIKSSSQNFRKRIVSEETCQTMRSILQKVVSREGTAFRAYLEDYPAAGKTGTAQKIDPVRGGYAENKYVASFIGFVPADDPYVTILVMVNDPPYRVRFGGTIAAPVFQAIAQDVMRYMENNGRIYGRDNRNNNQEDQS